MSEPFSMEPLGIQAKAAEAVLAHLTTEQKNSALQKIADQVWEERAQILEANTADLFAAKAANISEAMLDRLMLNEKRLQAIISDLRKVTELADPVNELLEEKTLPNGLHLRKQRVPLGVIAVIYEARPNVTVDVAGLALKSGNCVILRGGSETIRSNRALTAAIQRGLEATAVPANAVQSIGETDRGLVLELLQMDRYVDLVIPRGGAQLHDFCRRNSRIPVITGGMGICHLFVDESADMDRSIAVIRNAKIQRPSVCNALDTVLVHREATQEFLPRLVKRLAADGVTFRADPRAYAITSACEPEAVKRAEPLDFDTEWLSLVLGVKVVSGVEEAIAHIAQHSTSHSDGILTENKENAAKFVEQVDSAVVYVNASTRFTDGAQMGLGAEIAVSTQRLHARGPMGLNELTTYKWIIQGDYQVRP